MKSNRLHMVCCWLMLALPLALTAQDESPLSSAVNNACQENLIRATDDYRFGRFQVVIDKLMPCVEEGQPQDSSQLNRFQKARALRLIGLSYMATDRLKEAEEIVKRMMKLNPGYTSSAEEEPQVFQEWVDKHRPPAAPWIYRTFFGNRWRQALTTSAMVGALFLITQNTGGGGADGPQRLPDPPDLN